MHLPRLIKSQIPYDTFSDPFLYLLQDRLFVKRQLGAPAHIGDPKIEHPI